MPWSTTSAAILRVEAVTEAVTKVKTCLAVIFGSFRLSMRVSTQSAELVNEETTFLFGATNNQPLYHGLSSLGHYQQILVNNGL